MSINSQTVIGVTGHRHLTDCESLRRRVRECFSEILAALPEIKLGQHTFSVLSPLADGADRMVAEELLKQPRVTLEVILPLPISIYEATFLSDESRTEFHTLLSRAQEVRQPFAAQDAEAAYTWVGHYVVAQCDILIAVWNGVDSAGRGGTGDIVAHARRLGRPVCWINPDQPDFIKMEWGSGIVKEKFLAMDEYNQITAGLDTTAAVLDPLAQLRKLAREQSIDLPGKENADLLDRHFCIADAMALRYQQRHYFAGTTLYSLAALAVVIAATHSIFLQHSLLGGAMEIACLSGILAVIYLGKRGRWHTRWIEYRFLAERLRSIMHLAACGIEAGDQLRGKSAGRNQWMDMALSSLTSSLRPSPSTPDSRLIFARTLLSEAWLKDQADYHRRKKSRFSRRHHVLERIGVTLFFASFIGAITNLLTLVPAFQTLLQNLLGEHMVHSVQKVLTWISFSAPASGGAVAAINAHREFRKLADRSSEMALQLDDQSRRLNEAADWPEAATILTDAEELLSSEHAEWLANVRLHSLDSPV